MKKLLVLFSALSLFISCQDDDTVTTIPVSYTSSITINGEAFNPSPATSTESNVTTSVSYGAPNVSERSFVIRQNVANSLASRSIILHIVYSGDNASGTYTQYPGNTVEHEFTGDGMYLFDDMASPFTNGSTFTVTDKGNDTYKIEFHNVELNPAVDNSQIISGSIEGTFTNIPLEL